MNLLRGGCDGVESIMRRAAAGQWDGDYGDANGLAPRRDKVQGEYGRARVSGRAQDGRMRRAGNRRSSIVLAVRRCADGRLVLSR